MCRCIAALVVMKAHHPKAKQERSAGLLVRERMLRKRNQRYMPDSEETGRAQWRYQGDTKEGKQNRGNQAM